MLIEDDYTTLPADPELAFIQLEKKYRNELHESLRDSEDSNSDAYYLAYINQTLAAVRALRLSKYLPTFRGFMMRPRPT